MARPETNRLIEELGSTIDIPQSAYDKTKRRYEDLQDWLRRPESRCAKHSPLVYPQGSFRLGTVVRPITADGEYDLDLGCRMEKGISKATHTQKTLKELIGADLKAYRAARQIVQPVKEMRRCWRLQYADEMQFHLDSVPSIPETHEVRQRTQKAMLREGVPTDLASAIVAMAGAITDVDHLAYAQITDDWRVSNSQGYALWFESRMKQAAGMLHDTAIRAGRSRIDDLPAHEWKSPLQRAVQLLKRHRDVMFRNDAKRAPISVIITTLEVGRTKVKPHWLTHWTASRSEWDPISGRLLRMCRTQSIHSRISRTSGPVRNTANSIWKAI